jgi:hypothetical protein
MGRSKLDSSTKKRRYTFFLTPESADMVDSIPRGQRGRWLSELLERARDAAEKVLGGGH